MSQPDSCQYYLLRKDRQPICWNINDTAPRSEPDFFWTNSDYVAKVLQVVEQRLKVKDLLFYITYDELEELPSYGENVVVIMVGDEWCRIPMYFHKVLAVFRPYGISLFLGYNPLLKPSYLSFLNLIQFLRIWFDRLPGLLNYWFYRFKGRQSGKMRSSNIYTIPLGYYKQLELPIKDLELRHYDAFFAGSVYNDTYLKGSFKDLITKWIKPPKTLSRQYMIFNANKHKKKRPDLNIELSITSGFFSTATPDARSYSEQIMNAKICLVPRGTSFETYRFFEAIRYGCIVITEALPSRWYYDGSPAIQIKDWRHLGGILEDLLNHRERLQEKHQETLMWWKNKCSPEAVGQHIVRQLHLLKGCPSH